MAASPGSEGHGMHGHFFSVHHELAILTVSAGTQLAQKTLLVRVGFVRRARYALSIFVLFQ